MTYIESDQERPSQTSGFVAYFCVCTSALSLSAVCVRVWVSQQASQQSSPQAVWVVPALRQLHEITRSFIKQTYQKQDKVPQTHTQKNTYIIKSDLLYNQ